MTTKLHAITTMNREIFDRCGLDMIASFCHHVEDFELTVYVEGFVLPADFQGHVNQEPLSGTHFPAFRESCKEYPDRFGLINDVTRIGRPAHWKTQTENGHPYHFRLDAVKFSRKVFCLYHACHNIDSDAILWMDADTQVKELVSSGDLLPMIGDADIALLKRNHEYSEAGFYMVNLKADGMKLVNHFAGLYLTGDIFDLMEWHDSYVLDRAIEQTGVNAVSLSGKGADTNHPLANGPLGKWFYHDKGQSRKQRYRKGK